MPAKFQRNSETTMRVISAVCYLTGGIAGLIYAILNGRSSKDGYFRFHFIQALLISMLYMFFSWCEGAIGNILGGVLSAFGSAGADAGGSVGYGLSLLMTLVRWIYMLAMLLGVIQSLRGKYLEIPGISAMVRSNIR